MAVLVVGLIFLLAMAGQSDANFCVCNTGLSNTVYQTDIDYACGNGADCSAILVNGPCYNPNTVRDHCNYAVNSYYQRRAQVSGSCDFTGSASVVPTAPSAASGCVYQSSPSTGGSIAPPTPPNTGGSPPTNPGFSPPGSSLSPPGSSLSPPGSGFSPPGSGFSPPGSGFSPPGSSFSPPGIGLGPSGGFDNGASVTPLSLSTLSMLVFLSLTPLLSGLMC